MQLLDGDLPAEKSKPATQERMLYEQALDALPGLTVKEAFDAIQSQSGYIQQVYLIAEEDGLARDYILGMFPKPLDTIRETVHGN